MRGNIFSPEYMISNLVGFVLIILAIVRPSTTRWIFSFIFTGAAAFNTMTAIYSPEDYLSYASMAALPVYEDFINGFFSEHIRAFVISIAAAQLLIGMFITGRAIIANIALAGAAFFLLAIAPLGAGAAFPSSVLMAAACIILLFKKKQRLTVLKSSKESDTGTLAGKAR
jgi:hypothetical protein